MPTSAQAPAVPRLTYLRIKNYRALRDVEFRDLTPLTVLIGPNGSGKSTVLDALDFLAEAVGGNLKGAWQSRNRFAGMRTRGQESNIEIELHFSTSSLGHFKYYVSFSELNSQPKFHEELVHKVSRGEVSLLIGSNSQDDDSILRNLALLVPYREVADEAKSIFIHRVAGQYYNDSLLFENQVDVLLDFMNGFFETVGEYRLFHLTDDHLKGYSDAGPREKLSPNGDNLPNVLYYLHLKHPEELARIADKMRAWVPGLADVIPEITSDERLLLRFKDAPFEKPLPAQYMSGGTMRLAALLTLLYEPDATGLLGIEEPENELHPQLLGRLAEELIKATETRQLLVATHSPFLLDALAPEQVWILDRGADGYTHATRAADIPNVKELVEDGSPLGYLWSSNFFTVGNPLGPRSTPADAR
jgi:predicted ATPase